MPTITDWLMVVVTTVYVFATIIICVFNGKSAKATREQVAESIRQFEETQRLQVMPYLQFEVSDTDDSTGVPCVFIEMRNDDEDYTSTRIQSSIKNIGLGIAHHTRITVTTQYKKDDGYPAVDIVMPPNCEKKTYVQFNVKKCGGDTGRGENLSVHFKYDDVLGNTYTQDAQLVMIVSKDGARLLSVVDMKSPQLVMNSEETSHA